MVRIHRVTQTGLHIRGKKLRISRRPGDAIKYSKISTLVFAMFTLEFSVIFVYQCSN